jgi:hypothetical protein
VGISTFNNSSISNEIIIAKSGAHLWGKNCVHCHYTTLPETFSNVQRDVAVFQVRIRENLTEEELLKIADFLKSAN